MENTGLFNVRLLNSLSYPLRVLVWMDEETGESTYAVIKQFKHIDVEINRLTFEHLRRDPKISMTVNPELEN